MWTIGGGPEHHKPRPKLSLAPSSTTWDFGSIVNYSGPAGDRNYEGLAGSLPDSSLLIRDDERAGIEWFEDLNKIADEFRVRPVRYRPLGSNSNAFIYTIIRRGGLYDELHATGKVGMFIGAPIGSFVSVGTIQAPGWGILIPRK